ncbi:MAG TPA: phytanoyl-CoA dioxygenase family protein [Mycobacteriales bacterium]|jgi:hypothetical protein|nr:phytanoyl-CoA dioxygenase family protein [Mycobacteriales bacterium]
MELADAAAHWAEHGYVVLPAFLSPEETAAARAALPSHFPTAAEFHDDADPARNARFRDDEFGGIDTFPFASPELGLLAVHPKVVALAEAILGTEDVRLYACEAWAKYAGAAGYVQAHHRDFFNHTPLVPSRDPRFRQVETFVYLSDVDDGNAPTRFVSRTLTDHLPVRPHWWMPEERPELYDAEVAAAGPAGTVVAWSVDTFHRAVAFTDPRGARFTLQANYRAGANDWMNRHSWGDRSYDERWYPFAERASYRQLLLFGFPPRGHAFWTPDTLDAMAVRYPGMDLAPFRP